VYARFVIEQIIMMRFLSVHFSAQRLAVSMTCLAVAIAYAPRAHGQYARGTNSNADRAAPAASSQLQRLVNAVSKQFHIAYGHDAERMHQHREQLAAAVAAWRAAPRSAANDKLLADWLRTAIRKSMPGSREALPEVPEFSRPVATQPVATNRPQPNPSSLPTMRQKPVIENSAPTQKPEQSGQPAAGGTQVSRPTTVDGAKAASVAPGPTISARPPATTEPSGIDDFWTDHPANRDLPTDLSGGDPFGDDP
jgi:hypothetical protein